MTASKGCTITAVLYCYWAAGSTVQAAMLRQQDAQASQDSLSPIR